MSNTKTAPKIDRKIAGHEPRVLTRPPHGWGNKPNARLGDWLLLVFLMFCSAQFFRWAEAVIDAMIGLQ